MRYLIDLFGRLLVVRMHAGTGTTVLGHVLLRALISIKLETLRSMRTQLAVVEAAAVLRGADAIRRGTRLTAHV